MLDEPDLETVLSMDHDKFIETNFEAGSSYDDDDEQERLKSNFCFGFLYEVHKNC